MNLGEIKNLVALQLGLKEVGDDDHFMEDLGAESVDVVNIIAAVEDKFRIEIKESEIPEILTPAALFSLVKNLVQIV